MARPCHQPPATPRANAVNSRAMEDPYQTLGVQRDDSDDVIRSAYRKLAKRYHPDLNPGKPESADRFKAIASAYEILSDPVKRGRYDRGEIDAAGNEKPPEPPPYYHDMNAGGRYDGGPNLSPEDLEDLLGAAFAEQMGRRTRSRRGANAHYGLTVSFLDAANGAVRRLTLPDGRTLDVTIPAGLRDGHVLRLKGQGLPGTSGSAGGEAVPGDALIEVSVSPHPFFHRHGNDVVLELPVTLQEAVLGASIEVPTVKGKVRLTIPPNSNSGRRLRLAGRGIAGGNQVIELKVVLPGRAEPKLAEFLKDWQPEHPIDPRREMDQP
jgi:DnaJ-class molecular chaperone